MLLFIIRFEQILFSSFRGAIESLNYLLKGPYGVITYSPSCCTRCLFWAFASDKICFSLAYFVEVKRYFSWSGDFFKCLIFCLQLSICQQWIQSTSLFDLVLITSSLEINSFHSEELTLSIFFEVFYISRVFGLI